MHNFPIIKASLQTVFNSQLFFTCMMFILFDIFTGTTVALKNNVLNSHINKVGITKHFTIIIFIIFFSSLFIAFNMREFSKIINYFYIGTYGLSIFENLTLLGVPFPKWLQEKFLILKDESDKGENNVTERIEK